MDLLKVPAQITKVASMARVNGIRLQVDTQELKADDEAKIMSLRNQIGWFVFSPTGIKEEDVPVEPVEFENQKSLSERLRNVLWVLHEKRGGKPEDFEVFRHKYMERVISKIKEKISELDELN